MTPRCGVRPRARPNAVDRLSLQTFLKEKNEVQSKTMYLTISFSLLPKGGSHVWQTDLEEKLSADEREAYECTPSEETAIE